MADDQRQDDQPTPPEGDATRPAEESPSASDAVDAARQAVDRVGDDPSIDEDDLARAKASLDEAASVARGMVGDPAPGEPAAGAGEQEDVATEDASERLVTFDLPSFEDGSGPPESKGIDLLSDVNLNVTIELGRTRMLVEDVLKLAEGAVVELDKLAGDPVDVYVNDRLIARGEVLVLNDTFCIRVNEIVKQGADAVAEAG